MGERENRMVVNAYIGFIMHESTKDECAARALAVIDALKNADYARLDVLISEHIELIFPYRLPRVAAIGDRKVGAIRSRRRYF